MVRAGRWRAAYAHGRRDRAEPTGETHPRLRPGRDENASLLGRDDFGRPPLTASSDQRGGVPLSRVRRLAGVWRRPSGRPAILLVALAMACALLGVTLWPAPGFAFLTGTYGLVAIVVGVAALIAARGVTRRQLSGWLLGTLVGLLGAVGGYLFLLTPTDPNRSAYYTDPLLVGLAGLLLLLTSISAIVALVLEKRRQS